MLPPGFLYVVCDVMFFRCAWNQKSISTLDMFHITKVKLVRGLGWQEHFVSNQYVFDSSISSYIEYDSNLVAIS